MVLVNRWLKNRMPAEQIKKDKYVELTYAILNAKGEIKEVTPLVPTYSIKNGVYFITRKIQKTT